MYLRSRAAAAGAVILATGMICYLGVRAELVHTQRPAKLPATASVNLETEQENAARICARQSGDGC
jgi:hypothetical protein